MKLSKKRNKLPCAGSVRSSTRKLYRELGFSSIDQYAEMELGFSPTRTNDFIRLCRKLKTLPKVKEKVDSGELGYTAARVIAPIADQAAGISPRGENSPASKPPAQIHIHQCPDCAKATIQTSRGELEIGAAELARVQCDCQTGRPGERNTTAIPPAVRREVLARYRHQCQSPGCHHTRYLEVHHIAPHAAGGSNDPVNLVCLCSACHKLLHDRQQPGCVKSPGGTYEWRG